MAMDREALICDLAETYGIYDYRRLPASTVAVLASGLRSTSRIRMKQAGTTETLETMLQAATLDGVNSIIWMLSSGKTKRPGSIVEALLGQKKEKKNAGFSDPAEFDKAWKEAT